MKLFNIFVQLIQILRTIEKIYFFNISHPKDYNAQLKIAIFKEKEFNICL